MPWTHPLPPPTRGVNSIDPANDANAFTDALTASGAGLNVQNPLFGADPSGGTDSTTAILAAVGAAVTAGGGVVYFPTGTYVMNGSGTAALSVPGIKLRGDGSALTVISVGQSFTGAAPIGITADFCAVEGISIIGPTTGTTTLPGGTQAWNGIELTGVEHCKFRDVFIQNVNGWAVEAVGSLSRGCLDSMMNGIISRNCAGGFHIQGVTGSSFLMEMFIHAPQIQQCGVTTGPSANLDALRFQDCTDIPISDTNIGVAAGSGSAVHVMGACTALYFSGSDLGGGGQAVLIEDSGGNSPSDIRFTTGCIQESYTSGGLVITGGATGIWFTAMYFHRNQTDGVTLSGSGTIHFTACEWNTNGQGTTGATSYYEANLAGFTGEAYFRDCHFRTTLGTGAGNVLNPVNDPNHKGYFLSSAFKGANTTPSTVFATGTSPQIVRGCPGYSPRGSITAPTLPVGPQTLATSTSQHDVLIIFTAINTLTAFKIGGTAVGVLPVAGVPYRIPARQSLEVDYSGAAPSWQWFAE